MRLTDRLPTVCSVAVPGLVAGGLFVAAIHDQFVFDDRWRFAQLQADPRTLLEVLFDRWPVTQASFRMDLALWSDWAAGWHSTNVLLHALASAAVAWAALGVSRSPVAALATGLVFAVHPVHTEAVASIENRKDILAMLFVALALGFWVRPGRAALRYAAAVSCIALGLASKEVAAIGVVPMVFLADALGLSRRESTNRSRVHDALLRIAPIVLLGVVAAVVAIDDPSALFAPERIRGLMEGRTSSYREVLATSLATIPDALRLLAWPATLSAEYAVPLQSSLTAPRVLAGAALLLGLLALGAAAALRAPQFGFALLWIPITYLPCINLVPLTTYFLADRYLYVPSFGLCLLAGLAVDRALRRAEGRVGQSLVAVSLVAVVALGSLRSVGRCGDWRDERSLWMAAIASGHSTWRAHELVGLLAYNDGRHEEAARHLARAVELGPLIAKLRAEYALVLIALCRFDEARALVEPMERRPPRSPETLMVLEQIPGQLGLYVPLCRRAGRR